MPQYANKCRDGKLDTNWQMKLNVISINRYLHINVGSAGKERDFGITSVLASIFKQISIDQSHLSGICLHAQSMWRPKEAEHVSRNTIFEAVIYHGATT